MRANDIVFSIGSIGTSFYVILRGTVSVLAKHHKKLIKNDKQVDDDDKVMITVK